MKRTPEHFLEVLLKVAPDWPGERTVYLDRGDMKNYVVPNAGAGYAPKGTPNCERPFIVVTPAFVEFVGDDDELAYVMGHEAAHIILGHSLPCITREAFRARLTPAEQRANEVAADDWALRQMTRTGFDPKAAARYMRRVRVWEKRATTGPQAVLHMVPQAPEEANHPSYAERIARMMAYVRSLPKAA